MQSDAGLRAQDSGLRWPVSVDVCALIGRARRGDGADGILNSRTEMDNGVDKVAQAAAAKALQKKLVEQHEGSLAAAAPSDASVLNSGTLSSRAVVGGGSVGLCGVACAPACCAVLCCAVLCCAARGCSSAAVPREPQAADQIGS